MAFFTSQQLFGNGAGSPGSAGWVPIDTAAPPTFSANNRGIAFGEALTSAIANRPHYALALNDDDLNDRLSEFETGGLDAAYDLGLVATAGGGRVVTKDAGAVETASALASVYGDTERDHAHFRANMLGDTVGASLGFDVPSRRVGASAQTGDDHFAGFLDRGVFAKSTGLTQVTIAAAATLNPTGLLPTTVRLTAGQFGSGGSTDLARSYDLVEISGTAGGVHDGLYIFSQLGSSNTDAVLETLGGTSPVFGTAVACTITVYRARFGSFGAYTSRGRLFNTVMVGMPGATSTLDVLAGMNQADSTGGGAARALRVMTRNGSGSTTEAAAFDFLGRQHYGHSRSLIVDEYDKNYQGGSFASRRLVQGAGDVGHYVIDYDGTIDHRYDFLSLQSFDTPPGISPGIGPLDAVTLAFTGTSNSDGAVMFDVAQDSDLGNYLYGGGAMFVELTNTPSSGASDGLYYIHQHIISGNQGFYLRKLDGSVPSHFPTAGTCTLAGIFVGSGIGRHISFANSSQLNSAFTASVSAYNVFAAGDEFNATAAVFWAPKGAGADVERAFIRCFSSQPSATEQYSERFQVDAQGTVRARGGIYAGSGSDSSPGFVINTTNVNAEFTYGTARTRQIIVSLRDGDAFAGISAPGSQEWFYESASGYAYWQALSTNAQLYFGLNAYLREGMVITNIEVIVDPASTNTISTRLKSVTPNFGTPGANPVSEVSVANESSSGASSQVIDLSTSLGAGHTVDRDTRDYFLHIQGGSTAAGDRVYGIRLTVTDPGPRNF